MADQNKGKGGGARKYGQNRRQPSKMRYNGDSNKRKKIAAYFKKFPKATFPGWKYSEGYGWVKE